MAQLLFLKMVKPREQPQKGVLVSSIVVCFIVESLGVGGNMGYHGNDGPCQTEFCLAKRLRYWATSPWREDWLQVLWLNILALLVQFLFYLFFLLSSYLFGISSIYR